MAASPRRYKATLPTQESQPVEKRTPDRPQIRSLERKAAGRRRRFAMIVVVPVLLMLGSVYLHTVAAGLDAKAGDLEVRLDRVREEGERLEVRVAELSGAGRIREHAAEKLGMHEPKSSALKVYGDKVEDGTNNAKPQKGGSPR